MPAKEIVDRFLERQRAMYAGGELAPVVELLAENVVWHVPGASPIAGDYRGRDAVVRYFTTRRQLAGGAITIDKHGELSGDDVLVQLADGRASLGGHDVEWRTAGVYRVAGGRIAEAWLVPLDADAFDAAWARARAAPFVYHQRVRPQDCAASTFLGHPRFLEIFEAAFVEWWRSRAGGLGESLGADRRLTLASVRVDYRAPVRVDDVVRVDVALDRCSPRSLQLHYEAFVEHEPVATAGSRYVCLDAHSGAPAELPTRVARGLAAP
jgi:acyl-CoA thioesterase FadM/ketosteroid isomerase-like protein